MSHTSGGGPNNPPGFYRDAQGTMRWWDGSGWTEQVQEGGAPTANATQSKPWFKKKRWWVAGAVLLLIIISAASGSGSTDDAAPTATDPGASAEPSKKAKPSDEPTTAAPAEPKAMKVTASQILKDYENNEAAADGKYKGKTLQIKGVVAKVDTELFDDSQYVVQIGGGGQFEFITVNCDDQKSDDVSSLKKGDNITVVADFEDGGDLGVEVKNCKIL